MIYDAAVIGAGVTGAHIARELSRYRIRVALLERSHDICMGTTKANSAVVHAGYDAQPGSKKALLNLAGARLMPQLCAELHIPYQPIGSLLVAFSPQELPMLEELRLRGETNGVPGLVILNQEELRRKEPNISDEALAALYAPSAGIVCPFELCFAAVESAMDNGVTLLRNFAVDAIRCEKDAMTICAGEREIRARHVVNAAGVQGAEIAAFIGDHSIHTVPRKGEYLLLDRNVGHFAKHVLFQCPNEMGKGVLVTPTVDGNLLVGPSAQDTEDSEDCSTTTLALEGVTRTAQKTLPALPVRGCITSFAGLRAHSETDDFILEFSAADSRMYHAAGIESPGLTAAPAIGAYAAKALAERGGFALRDDFNPTRRKPVRFREMDNQERRALIAQNNAYGRIVCRCETVTEGEVRDAIRANGGAVDLDGVKRRVRAGAGRCQGGFCGPQVLEILCEELNLPPEGITKSGGESWILSEKTK